MKIWAHRGCSQRYPENTLLAFEKAMQIKGLTGIELDIQLTKDNQMVVIHDEKVNRTTNGCGNVQDFTLEEIRRLKCRKGQRIPTIEEVLDLLEPAMRDGLMLNIELKNGVFRYEGMEEMITELIRQRNLEEHVIYSTFYAHSVKRLRELVPDAEIGILDRRLSDCLYKMQGGCGANALHPFWRGIDIEADKGTPVRAWFSGHLFPEKPTGNRLDLETLEQQGITDVFLNEPEVYL